MDSKVGRWTGKAVLAGSGTVLVAALLAIPPAFAATAQQWQLAAPGGAGPVATVSLDTSGRLALMVNRGGTQVLPSSALGIRTTAADLSTGLRFGTRADVHVTEQYATAVGRRRDHTVDANQTTLSFTKGSSRLDVVFRVSADGLGYRYVVRQSGTVTVTGEASEFAVPASAKAVLLPYDNGRNDYESVHVHTTVAQAAPVAYGYPSLFHVGDTWLLVTESDSGGGYGASRLTLDGTTRHFRLTLPDARETNAATLTTPWRTMVLGDLATVTESDLVTDLASPSKVADTSWIKPGRSEWSWWSDSASSKDLTAQERAADFAAKMGWEYILVDAGWSASWMPTLVKYANARQVGVFVWTSFSALDTAAERNAKLPLWKSWGVAGLKIDFVQSDGQARMQWYDAILAAAAKQKLMVEFHGCTIPRGIERTWPHVVTMEAVRGAEAIHNKPTRVPFPADYYTALPFTRNLAGSMDYTPVTFTAKRTNSDAAELAQSVVFESGLQNFADSVASYDSRPTVERFLRQVPSVWDDTRLVSGWLADVYSDGTSGVTVHTQQVSNASTLTVAVPANGGFTAHLCPAKPGATNCGT
ncbi:MAG: alpha-glucosidase [Actinobacteria bacterium 13_2_20CM_2_71_6]|nr:MAG: alpha-glucosidase [Actinobacteria bacterium 13_2_20CM_2_71_6]